MLSPSYSINLFKEHIYIQQHLHFEFSVFLNQSSLPEIFISGKGKKKKKRRKKKVAASLNTYSDLKMLTNFIFLINCVCDQN